MRVLGILGEVLLILEKILEVLLDVLSIVERKAWKGFQRSWGGGSVGSSQ